MTMELAWLAETPEQTPTLFDALLHHWLGQRAGAVAGKTLRTDQDLLRLIPGV